MKHLSLILLTVAFGIASASPVQGQVEVFPFGSSWKYILGTSEPSVDWPNREFNDTTWTEGAAPVGYGEPVVTTLPSSTAGGYTTVYLRRHFTLADPADVAQLTVELNIDDGGVVYINGAEIGRDTAPAGAVAFNAVATSQIEPHMVTLNADPDINSVLVAGDNVIAVHLLNGASSSSDIFLDARLTYIEPDPIPPVIAGVEPAGGSTINQLTQVTVTFSEPVSGVDPSDIVINSGNNALAVTGSGAVYTFTFPQPPYGAVTLNIRPGHGIADLAIPPNPYDETAPTATWSYTLVDNFPPLVAATIPTAGSTVRSLTQIQVRFSEGVSGVGQSDLLINNDAATSLMVLSPSEYIFGFDEPMIGPVDVTWAIGHGIADLSPNANAFQGGGWSYTLDPNAIVSDVLISEFLTSNGEAFAGDDPSLVDEDGDFEDWIEIYNPGETTVSLLNWSLTDSAGNLNQWRFPDTNILAGEFMIIFASGKNRREPGAELHTNFRLNTTGEYLALVRPDGTIASQFSPLYPPQLRNVSYGYGFDVASFTLIPSNATARILVPADGSLGDNWKLASFVDTGWTAADGAFGYDTQQVDPAEDSIPASVFGTNPEGYWRFSETSGTIVANEGTLGASANGLLVSGPLLNQAGPRPPAQDGFEANNTAVSFSGANAITTSSQVMNNRSAFTMCGWIRPMATQLNRTGLFGQNDAIEFGFINPTTIQIWTPGNGGSINVAYSFPVGQWHHVAVVGTGSGLQVYYDGVLAGSGGGTVASYGSSAFNFNIGGGGIFDSTTNFFNGLIDEVAVYTRALTAQEILAHVQPSGGSTIDYDALVETDVESAMLGINSSLFVRIPFQVADASLVDRLMMNVQYDDGFAAYLNGDLVASRNAPELPTWDAAATARNPDTKAIRYEEVNLSGFTGSLQNGDNVLAIQAMNIDAANTDFLIHAMLSALSSGTLSSSARYFVTPTPGDPNGAGSEDIGPIIQDVTHSPQVLTDNDNLVVTARVIPSFSPVVSFTLHYRIQFGPTLDLVMFDDGTHGDGAAADGLFGNIIPAAANSAPRQMVRYFLTATDIDGNSSRWPLYEDQSIGGSEQYLGTIVIDPNLTSKLPIFELFVETSQLTGIDNENGGRVAVFHDGELYDNVYMEVRGNTTAGYTKKSHRFEFPREHRLRHPGADWRVRNTSFTADFGDPTYMRQGLSFWLANEFGVPAPFYYPCRLEMNGSFYQLANHNNVIRGEILEPLGYDDRGALYQAAGTVQTSQFSTGNFRKRTRLNESNADYQALAAGIVETVPIGTREVNVFDMLDVPQIISYLVVGRWVHENDDVWANMSLYRDTEGDRLWRIIPFDMNLSWGAIFYEGGNPTVIEGVQATNDIHKAFPLYGSSQALPVNSGNYNRIYDVMFQVPRTRAMFLRRMRTLLDTYVKPPGTSPLLLPFEKRIRELQALMLEEANRDRTRWGWPAKGGQTNFDPGIGFDPGVQAMIDRFIGDRRTHLYVRHSVNNTSVPIGIMKNQNAGIPNAQPANALVMVGAIEVNPSSGNQGEEYICLTNINDYAVDISGWELHGAVEFMFKQGTVIPAHDVLYVSPDVNAFRARAVSPRGGQGRFVVGNYNGKLSARGENIEIFDQTGRGVSTNSYPGNPSLAQQYLRVTELMYNPRPDAGGPVDPQSYEYLELKNIGPSTLDLTGVKFVTGIQFTFGSGASLAAGASLVLVRDTVAYLNRYGAGATIGGVYSGFLDSAGERLVLLDGKNEEILDFSYNNSWYPITDGLGFSLVVVDENAEPDLWRDRAQWRPSSAVNGTPGANNPAAPTIAPIVVSEILTHTDFPVMDTVELHNPTASPVNLGGWFLSDDFNAPMKYRIPNDTFIAAGGYRTFDESVFNTNPGVPPSFSFSSKGDDVYLFSGDPAVSQLTGYFDGFDFGAAFNGVTFGPHVKSDMDVDIVPLVSFTPNAANSGPKVGPVVISELMYRPPDQGAADNTLDEFVELHNLSAAPVSLDDPADPWRLGDAVDYTFPAGVSIPAGGYLVVVSFDPAIPGLLNNFRARYGMSDTVPVYGPYSGKLDNSSDDVELLVPDAPEMDETPLVRVDRVRYRDEMPWPVEADGSGPSLQRLVAGNYGNDPANWFAGAPTPGGPAVLAGPPMITMQPLDVNVVALEEAVLGVVATGSGPLRYQWHFEGEPLEGATSAMLTLTDVIPEQAGLYSVLVYNRAGVVLSRLALLNVVIPANIFSPPRALAVDLGQTAVFTVGVASSGPIQFQWRFNGVPIDGETGDTLTIVNAEGSDDGLYDVVVSDGVSSQITPAVRLTVLIDPAVSNLVTRYFVVDGGSVTLSVDSDGSLPLTYRWRRRFATLKTEVANNHVSFVRLVNVTTNDGGAVNFTCIITNAANFQPGIVTPNIFLTILPDVDKDLLPDAWESQYGVSDPASDDDMDDYSNEEEYQSGTNPIDPGSYLRVEGIEGGEEISLEFNAVSNSCYTIEYKEFVDGVQWSKLTDIASQPTNRLVRVIDDQPAATRFYRLVTPGQEGTNPLIP